MANSLQTKTSHQPETTARAICWNRQNTARGRPYRALNPVVLGPGLDRLLAIGLPNLPGPWAWAGP
jgi:hypothetical protein